MEHTYHISEATLLADDFVVLGIRGRSTSFDTDTDTDCKACTSCTACTSCESPSPRVPPSLGLHILDTPPYCPWDIFVNKDAASPAHQHPSQDNARQSVPQLFTVPTIPTPRLTPQKARPTKRNFASAQNYDIAPTKRRRQFTHPECASRMIDCKLVQFLDCKTKDGYATSRHKHLQSNILPDQIVPNGAGKYYRLLEIVRFNDGTRQLQTPCFCGRTRTFLHRRAIRKGVAITYFKANKCKCGHVKAHQLLMCFCGALFQSLKSLYACPCFKKQGPAFAMLPNYAEFAARGCPCPVKPQRYCRCMADHVSTVSQ